MSSFSLLSMSMVSSWCAIIETSLCKWRKNFFKSLKWKILKTCISSWAWKWKGIMNNILFISTKLGISRRFSSIFTWIAKPLEWHLILKQRWKKMNKDDEMVLYQQVVGSLMYAMLCIWFDLAYPISMVNLSLDIGLWSNAFFDICKAPCNSNYNLEEYCCNLSLELATKAKGLQGCGQD